MPRALSERSVLLLVGAVQFVNVLDFMMVMPLGPDFATALGIPTHNLGLIGGSYTASASVAGLAGAFFLDRFDRRKALAVAMAGLVLATAAGGLATGLPSLLAARILAGAFGGPATALSLAIVADIVPAHRRGKALGTVMSAFAVASVLGVPAGLELSRQGGWRLPFFAVAALGLVVAASAVFLLPSLTGHLAARRSGPGFLRLLRRPVVLLSSVMTATAMMGTFALIPNISTFIQQNLGYPRERLGFLYMAGGLVSFAAVRIAGRLVDRLGSPWVGAGGTAALLGVLFFGFVLEQPPLPVMPIFVLFMLTMAFRNIPYSTLISRVPAPEERAGFMSLQSALQHGGSAAGAMLSSRLLTELPDHRLAGMQTVALLAMGLTALLPIFLVLVDAKVPRAGVGGPGRVEAPV